ncbi:MAG: ATP-binding protein [bacterium JZ-2024 1]
MKGKKEILEEMIAGVAPRSVSKQRIVLQALVEKNLLEPGAFLSVDQIVELVIRELKRGYALRGREEEVDENDISRNIWQILKNVSHRVRRWAERNQVGIKVESHPVKGFRLIVEGVVEEVKERGERKTGNLPCYLSRFIGRRKEMEEVKGHLRQSPLVTLTGIGGIGKSRLAVEVGREMAEEFPDGAWFVDLSLKEDGEITEEILLSVFPVSVGEGKTALDAVVEFLRGKRALVILDNCERVVKRAALWAERMLKESPGCRILATSREALGIAGEVIYSLPPMSVPEIEGISLLRLEEYDAVALFLDRARAVKPDFALNHTSAHTVVKIVKTLEGIPLSIEIAAGKVRALSPEQILLRLTDALNFLVGGSRTAPARHQTIRAAIKSSFDYLSVQERKLFARLAVFSGPFSPSAMEKICSGEGVAERDVLNLAIQLVEKSLLAVEEGVENRFRLLESVRLFAQEVLVKFGEEERFRQRHFEYFTGRVRQAREHSGGEGEKEWLDRIEREYGNISSAIRWGVSRFPENALKTALALEKFYDVRGYWGEGENILKEILARNEGVDKGMQAQAMLLISNFAWRRGKMDEAEEWWKKSLSIGKRIKTKKIIASVYHKMGNLALSKGDYPSAIRYYRDALPLYEKLSDEMGMASVWNNLGYILGLQGNYAEAEEYLKRALAVFQKSDDKIRLTSVLQNFSRVAYCRRDYLQAMRYGEEALRLARSLGNRRGEAVALSNLAVFAREMGHLEAAKALYSQSLDLHRELGHKWGEASVLLNLGVIAIERGEYVEARVRLEECFRVAREIEDREILLHLLEKLARVERAEGNPEGAARLLGIMNALKEETNYSLPESDRERLEKFIAELKLAMGETAFLGAFLAGGEMYVRNRSISALEGEIVSRR